MNARAVFYDEEQALATVRSLVSQGFEASLSRQRFAGEDDDEDHPWAVITDAPETMLEVLVEEYDGWLDVDNPPTPPVVPPSSPLDLPNAPKRIKNHFPRD
jgi:hypothetical protein